jgi:hypothetical protein
MASNQDMQMLLDSYERAIKTAEDASSVGDMTTKNEAVSIANQLKAEIDNFQSGPQEQVVSSEDQSRKVPDVVSTITGFTPSQEASRAKAMEQLKNQSIVDVSTGLLRYAPPVVAGFAFGPEAVPVAEAGIGAALRSMISLSAKTGAAGLAGETAAQLAEVASGERDKFNPKKITSQTILSAFPQLNYGGKYARSLVNSAFSIGALEAANAIENGEFKAPKDARETLLRVGLPVALSSFTSTVSATAEKSARAAENANRVTNERWGGGILVSDVLPEATALEKGAVEFGNEIANSQLREVGSNIGPVIDMAFKDVPSTSPISALIAERKGVISNLRNNLDKARAESQAAQQRYQIEKANNGPQIRDALAKAQDAAFEESKQALLYNEGIDALFPSKNRITGIEASVAEGQRKKLLQDISDNSKRVVKNQIDGLYSAAGVGANNPVINKQGAISAISSAKFRGKGGLLEDNEMYAKALDIIKKRFDESSSIVAKYQTTAPGQMTRGQFQRLRDDIAESLVADGKPRDAAARFASGLYEALQGTSDNFVKNSLIARNGRALGSKQFDAYLFARGAAASDFKARSAGAIDAMASGDIKGLYGSIKSQGAGPVLDEIDAYARVIAGSGNPQDKASVEAALKASDSFKKNFYSVIADSVIDANLHRGTGQSGSRIVNVAGMAKDLDELASKGFPVEQLGLGAKDQIKALARIGGAGKTAGYTTDELAQFFNDAQSVGANQAAAKVDYYRAVRANFLDGKANIRSKLYNQENLRKIAKQAGVTENDMNLALEKASQDPLAVFMDRVQAGDAPNVSMANGNELVSSLLRTNPDTVKGLMNAMPASAAEDLRKAAAAQVMRQFEPVARSKTPNKADIKSLVQFFEGNGASEQMQRASFRNILGNERYDVIFNQMYGAVKSASESINRMASAAGQEAGTTPLAAGRAKARFGDVAFYMNPANIIDWVNNGRYNLLYNLYVNPERAPAFKKVSGNLNKFTSITPLNRHVVDLANQADKEDFGFNQFQSSPSIPSELRQPSQGGNIGQLLQRLGSP